MRWYQWVALFLGIAAVVVVLLIVGHQTGGRAGLGGY